jgi:hypothetical protein
VNNNFTGHGTGVTTPHSAADHGRMSLYASKALCTKAIRSPYRRGGYACGFQFLTPHACGEQRTARRTKTRGPRLIAPVGNRPELAQLGLHPLRRLLPRAARCMTGSESAISHKIPAKSCAQDSRRGKAPPGGLVLLLLLLLMLFFFNFQPLQIPSSTPATA